MPPLTRRYVTIEKMHDAADGTLHVFGVASTETRDDQGEIITSAAMKAALPDYMKWGAVREMHQPKAAGTALEAEVRDDGATWIGIKVVDPIAIEKCRHGVYKGFSVGGKATARDTTDRKTITGFDLIEVSLVDRPANPDAVMMIHKRAGVDEEPDTPATEATPVTDQVKKGIYSVKCFADLLEQLSWMARDAAFEAMYEGDASPVPAKLRAWISDGASILAEMTAEEIAELLATIGAAEPVKAAFAAITTAKEAGATLALVRAELETVKAERASAGESVTKLGGEKSEIEKRATALEADVQKLTGERDAAVAKISAAEEAAKAATDTLAHYEKQVAEFSKEMLAKGVLRVVEKSGDAGVVKEPEKSLDPKDPNVVANEIRKVHQAGGMMLAVVPPPAA